jgi:hypothetical protein
VGVEAEADAAIKQTQVLVMLLLLLLLLLLAAAFPELILFAVQGKAAKSKDETLQAFNFFAVNGDIGGVVTISR